MPVEVSFKGSASATTGEAAVPSCPTTPAHAAPSPAPPAGRPRTRDLADVFGREPELIAACLQDAEQASPASRRQVLAAARRAVARYPNFADLHYHAGQAAMATGEVELARELLDRALRIHPDYKDALLLAARVEQTRHRVQEAERLLQRALAAGADYPDVHVLLGQVCAAQGRWSDARRAYHRALELNGRLAAARDALANLPEGEDERGTP